MLLPRKLHADAQIKLSRMSGESVLQELRGYTEEMGKTYVKPLGGVGLFDHRVLGSRGVDLREEVAEKRQPKAGVATAGRGGYLIETVEAPGGADRPVGTGSGHRDGL